VSLHTIEVDQHLLARTDVAGAEVAGLLGL
jgi:hypothetical protein